MGTGPFKFVEWKQTDYLKVAKFDGYWKKGLPKVDTITWKPVIDNNSRSAMMQTGEAHFTFPVPYEQVDTLKAKADLEVVAAPSIVHRYMSMNMLQKPFDNPKVRQAINYAINKEALAKVAFNGYAFPAEGATPQGRRVRTSRPARGRTTSPRPRRCSPRPATRTASRPSCGRRTTTAPRRR